MLAFNSGTGVKYKSHGIRDAAQMSGHDFVVSRLDPDYTLGSYCVAADGPDGPVTRTDSAGGRLFAGTPTDFVCLNEDDDADQQPDYLDGYDARVYSAATYCPFDPSDPPVLSHTVSGTVTVLNSETLDLSTLQLVTSDGPNNCQVTTPFSAVTNGYSAQYSCTVWDWGSGWTGTVQVRPYSTDIYCASDTAAFADMMTDQTADFSCSGTSIINIGGSIKYLSEGVPVTAIAVTNLFSNESGVCAINDTATAYECKLPYTYLSTDFELAFKTLGYVCNSTDGSFSFAGMSKEDSPITFDIGVSSSADACLLMEPAPDWKCLQNDKMDLH